MYEIMVGEHTARYFVTDKVDLANHSMTDSPYGTGAVNMLSSLYKLDDGDEIILACENNIVTLMGVHIYLDDVASQSYGLRCSDCFEAGYNALPSTVIFIPNVKRSCHTDGYEALEQAGAYSNINKIIADDMWIQGDKIAIIAKDKKQTKSDILAAVKELEQRTEELRKKVDECKD
jgi:hypothetical protein